jgi:hypothetical protein
MTADIQDLSGIPDRLGPSILTRYRLSGRSPAARWDRISRQAKAIDREAYAMGLPGRFQRPPVRRAPSPLKSSAV